MSDELPLDRPEGHDLVDRSRADQLVRDHRPKGTIRIGRAIVSPRRIVAAVAGVLVAYFVITLAQFVHTGGAHGADPADAIVVMGAAQYDGRPSPQLAARLDHVVTLWDAGVAPLIVVTGGKQPDDRFTEAEASAAYLVDRGVPASAIVEVGEGASTYESVVAAAPEMTALGVESVALVTDPYHGLRSRLIVEAEGFDVDVATTPTGVVTGARAVRRHIEEAAGVALGRLVGFDRLSELAG